MVVAKTTAFDRYLAVVAKGNGGGLTVRPNRELWKPFQFEATLGLFDPKHADLGGGSFGVSVLESSGIGSFTIVSVRRSGAGIVVEASTGGTDPIGSLQIPDGLVADVAMETVAGTVVVSARKHGDATFTPVGSVPATNAGPYQVSFDARDLPKGTIAGFDFIRLLSNGAPTSQSTLQQARETVYTALDALAEAGYALDGASPDRAAAGAQLDRAALRLQAALDLPLDGFASARKKIGAAHRTAGAVASGVKGAQAINTAILKIIRALKLTGRAASALRQ